MYITDHNVLLQMLTCIVSMVDKTKRALAVLQERSLRDREELNAFMRRHSEGFDSDMKKRHADMMATTLRQTEDRVSDVKRRAGGCANCALKTIYHTKIKCQSVSLIL